VELNLFLMWESEVPMPVWIRGRRACLRAWAATSMSFCTARLQTAYCCVLDDLSRSLQRSENHRGLEDREAGFEDVYSQGFQLQGQFDFFFSVEFAARYLFSIPERGIKNENLFVDIEFFK